MLKSYGWVVAPKIFVSAAQSPFGPFGPFWGWNWVGLGWDWVWGDWGLRGWGLGLDNMYMLYCMFTFINSISIYGQLKV